MESTAYACSLDDQELAERRREWRNLEARALLRTESLPEGRLMVYRGDDRTASALASLIEAERRCCPWLRFEVHAEGDEVRLLVRFPTEARSSAADLEIIPAQASGEVSRPTADHHAPNRIDARGRDLELAEVAERVAACRPALGETGEQIALGVARRLLDGAPVPVVRIAEEVGLPLERVESRLSTWPGCVLRDEDGCIIGFSGLSLAGVDTPHRLRVAGKELVAWCAWDMLLLPHLLDREAEAFSTCPVTGERISMVVSSRGVQWTSHPQAVVSFLIPERGFGPDVIQSFCRFVHLFASRETGEAWISEHPGTFLVGLDEGFELGRRINQMTFPNTIDAER